MSNDLLLEFLREEFNYLRESVRQDLLDIKEGMRLELTDIKDDIKNITSNCSVSQKDLTKLKTQQESRQVFAGFVVPAVLSFLVSIIVLAYFKP